MANETNLNSAAFNGNDVFKRGMGLASPGYFSISTCASGACIIDFRS